MFKWIAENISTILVFAALLLIAVLIIRSLVRNKRQGKSSCGCNCAHCAMAGQCHGKKK